MRSVLPFVVLSTRSPDLSWPEYTRKYVSLPTNGSDMTLNTRAENGASIDAGLVSSSSVFGSMPWTAGTSSGLGR
jgi:hypothetical protein